MVVDETLLKTVNVTKGIKPGGALIINTHRTADEIREQLKGVYDGRVCTVDAEKISVETLGKYFPNTPMLAAAVKVSKVIEEEQFIRDMEESFRNKFPTKPHLVEGNMNALKRTLKEFDAQ